MSREEVAGIRQQQPRWELRAGADDVSEFLAALALLVPDDSFLFLEGGSHPRDLRRYLAAHNVVVTQRPALGTIWPRHFYFTVPASAETLTDLAQLTRNLPYPEVCEHLHVFLGEEVLLEGYDAFCASFHVSTLIPEAKVRGFCAKISCEYREIVAEAR